MSHDWLKIANFTRTSIRSELRSSNWLDCSGVFTQVKLICQLFEFRIRSVGYWESYSFNKIFDRLTSTNFETLFWRMLQSSSFKETRLIFQRKRYHWKPIKLFLCFTIMAQTLGQRHGWSVFVLQKWAIPMIHWASSEQCTGQPYCYNVPWISWINLKHNHSIF